MKVIIFLIFMFLAVSINAQQNNTFSGTISMGQDYFLYSFPYPEYISKLSTPARFSFKKTFLQDKLSTGVLFGFNSHYKKNKYQENNFDDYLNSEMSNTSLLHYGFDLSYKIKEIRVGCIIAVNNSKIIQNTSRFWYNDPNLKYTVENVSLKKLRNSESLGKHFEPFFLYDFDRKISFKKEDKFFCKISLRFSYKNIKENMIINYSRKFNNGTEISDSILNPIRINSIQVEVILNVFKNNKNVLNIN